jgi:hypothetical protein
MTPVEFFIGFHSPYFRNEKGRIDPRGWLGHCEVWFYTHDETWGFFDPAGAGSTIRVCHRFEEVQDMLTVKTALCETILKVPAVEPRFSLPLHGMLTCAAVCGHILGRRALTPAGLRRKLLRDGAETVYARENPEGRSCRQGRAGA